MVIGKTLYVATREEWRDWLSKHGQSEPEVWLVYYKKQSGRARIPYDHAVEEALCFGWIDGIGKRIDDEKFAQRFSPRRNRSKWSALNERRVRKLIRDGRMTDAGLAKIDAGILDRDRKTKASREEGRKGDVPRSVKQALIKSPKAWKNFESLTRSRRAAYVRLIMEAKKEETREQRVRQAITLLEQSQGDLEGMPSFFKKALKARPKAWKFFQSLAPSYRRHYIGWIMHAKQEETRQRRLREAVSLLEQNQKLGLK